MSNEVAVRSNIKNLIEADRTRYEQIAPKDINMDRFITSAAIAIYENPKLQECDPVSIRAAAQTGAELGLDFTKVKGHAYLVPFGGKCVFIPGWRGLVDLAKRDKTIKDIQAHLVYANDHFVIQYGTDPKLDHVPCISGDRGAVVGGYAVGFFTDGGCHYEFMTIFEMDKIKNQAIAKARDKNKSPWTTDVDEMYRKTPIRRLCKYLPSNPDLDKALELSDNAYESTESIPAAISPEVSAELVPPGAQKPGNVGAPPVENSNPAPERTKRTRRTKAEIKAARAQGIEPTAVPAELPDGKPKTPAAEAPEGAVDLW